MGGDTEDVLHIPAQLRRQPLRRIPQLERRPVGAELQLGRQRLQRQRSPRPQPVSSFSRCNGGSFLL